MVKSVTSGSESITYSDAGGNTSIASLVGNKSAQNEMLFDVAREYLGDTGLLSQIIC